MFVRSLKNRRAAVWLVAASVVASVAVCTDVVKAQTTLPSPLQDKGLPYTRSATPRAVALVKDAVAVFPGSRYAYVKGLKVRLDEVHWRDEAVLRDGVVYVPVAFAGLVTASDVKAAPAPEYLKSRWVYEVERPAVSLPPSARKIDVDGRPYVAVADLATTGGLKVVADASGLTLVGTVVQPIDDPVLRDCVVTLFDTPDKYADPEIATKHVPQLARQGKWTDHVKVTPEQLAVLNGPETKWEYTPKSKYDYKGFNEKLLGSAVPPPGVYPRILFSEADLPMLAERIKSNKLGMKSWIEREYLLGKSFWDPKTSDGRIFQKLASGDVSGLEWPETKEGGMPTDVPQQFKGQKPGIHNSHVAYVPEALTAMALQCLLERDDVRGRQVAAAIVNYFKLREPLVDEWLAVSDSEFGTQYLRPNGKVAWSNGNGSATQWRNIHGVVAQMNLGLALDFGGKWMTDDEKAFMQRFIAKATYGRRGFAQDGSPRFRDINWCSWDLPNYLALLAIEGLPGCDREAIEANRETLRAFCEWGIDPSGVVYESNGKTPGGFQFLFLSMVADARRTGSGGENLFGHPNFRALLNGQIQMTSPSGKVIVNSGTQYVPYSRQVLSPQLVAEFKAFYPENRSADYLLTQEAQLAQADPKDETARFYRLDDYTTEAAYRQAVAKIQRLRMASPTYPGFVRSFLYDADFVPTTRDDLKLSLDFSAPVHGIYSAYSDRTPQAVWINMMVRPDHYLGAGHHHADAGMFHFSALGVDWITESPFTQAYAGRLHNQVLVDGKSEAETLEGAPGTSYQAAATYVGATVAPGAAASIATADLTYSYTWTWQTQPSPEWPADGRVWEMDPSPQIAKIFAGTARYKMRPWWPTSTFSNYIATSRAPFNPMEYVFRSTAIVRGSHPYAMVVDDLKKDGQPHLYEWTAMLNGGVWQANVDGLSPNEVVLGYRKLAEIDGPDPKVAKPHELVVPAAGDPLVLVVAVGADPAVAGGTVMKVTREAAMPDRKGAMQYYDRLAIPQRLESVKYRVLLVPYRFGQPKPSVSWDAATGTATVKIGDQVDEVTFATAADHLTRVTVKRAGAVVLAQP